LIRTFPPKGWGNTILAWSQDARSLAVGNVLYEVATGRQIATYPPAGTLVSQAWSPDGRRLAVSTYSGTGLYSSKDSVLSLIDSATGRLIARYDQGDNPSTLGSKSLVWSPNGQELLVVRNGIEIWRAG
jgi:WD40 repeat protein